MEQFWEQFWRFNVLEVFAAGAIVIGGGWALKSWLSERSRKRSLVKFPPRPARRDFDNNLFHVIVETDVFVPHYAIVMTAQVWVEGKEISIEFELQQHITQRERWLLQGDVPLSTVPEAVEEIEIAAEVVLDGRFRVKRGRYTVPIEGREDPTQS